MSGVVRGIKRAFKKVVRFVKKIAKPLLIAAAVYFTAGLALAAMPATAGFAAALPGFAGAAGAGTGILSKLAVKVGLGSLGPSGGLIGGALAKGTSAAALAKAGVGAKALAAGAGKAAAAGVTKGIASGVSTVVAGAQQGAALGALSSGTAAVSAAGGLAAPVAKAGMTLSEKLLLASTGMQIAGGLLAPSPREIEEAQRTWVGAYYGTDAKGGSAPAPQNPLIPAAQPRRAPAQQPAQTAGTKPMQQLTPAQQAARTG
jgi:hypothetical protein